MRGSNLQREYYNDLSHSRYSSQTSRKLKSVSAREDFNDTKTVTNCSFIEIFDSYRKSMYNSKYKRYLKVDCALPKINIKIVKVMPEKG